MMPLTYDQANNEVLKVPYGSSTGTYIMRPNSSRRPAESGLTPSIRKLEERDQLVPCHGSHSGTVAFAGLAAMHGERNAGRQSVGGGLGVQSPAATATRCPKARAAGR